MFADLSEEEIASIYVVCQWARTSLEKIEPKTMQEHQRHRKVWDCLGRLENVSKRLGYPGHIQNYELMLKIGWMKNNDTRRISK
jgi:hypothetical protein